MHKIPKELPPGWKVKDKYVSGPSGKPDVWIENEELVFENYGHSPIEIPLEVILSLLKNKGYKCKK